MCASKFEKINSFLAGHQQMEIDVNNDPERHEVAKSFIDEKNKHQ